MEDSAEKILRQVEFYFSDLSYCFDEWLRGQCDDAGFIPLTTIAGFAKMKTLNATDPAVIAAALETSDSVCLNEAKDGVARKFPMPLDDPALARTVHITTADAGASAESITQTMTPFGAVESVRLLRNMVLDARPLDGTAFVIYSTEESAAAAAAASPVPRLTTPAAATEPTEGAAAEEPAATEATTMKLKAAVQVQGLGEWAMDT